MIVRFFFSLTCAFSFSLSLFAMEISGSQTDRRLHEAVVAGKTQMVRTLLKMRGVNVNAEDAYGRTPLIVAIARGMRDIVQILLAEPSLDVVTASFSGDTPLSLAARFGYINILRDLFGSDYGNFLMSVVNKRNERGETPLIEATGRGHLEAVQFLLSLPGIEINAIDKEGGTPLITAAKVGKNEIAKALLTTPLINAHPIDVTARNRGGDTAFSVAAKHGHVAIMRDLIDSPYNAQILARINNRNSWGETPLISLAKIGCVEGVKLLLGLQGIDVNSADSRGDTALIKAVGAPSHAMRLVQELLKIQDLELNTVNNSQQTALAIAVNCRRFLLITMLLQDKRCTPKLVQVSS